MNNQAVIRVGIHGFGRIGRSFLHTSFKYPTIQVVAIADVMPETTARHLFQYDSVHGKRQWPPHTPVYLAKSSPQDIPDWSQWEVDVVLEATGTMKTSEELLRHVQGGAKKVLLSAPTDDTRIPMLVWGLQSPDWHKTNVLSCASCTTNSAAHMIQLLDENFGIESCYITTVHSYTGDQKLHDSPHADLRRGRAANLSIVPTTTGAAKALNRIFPHLSPLGGCGMRVPVPDGSLTDITCIVKKDTTCKEINDLFRRAASTRWRDVLEYSEEPLVSRDILGNGHSCILDSELTSVIGKMVKVVGWYDNEMGYSHRLCDVITQGYAEV